MGHMMRTQNMRTESKPGLTCWVGGGKGYRARIEIDSELREFAIREKKPYQNRVLEEYHLTV